MAARTERIVNDVSRRMFVATLAGALPILAVPRAVRALSTKSRKLDFEHTHTGEKLSVKYFDDGDYVPEALTKVNYFLRDFRTGDIHTMDPKRPRAQAIVIRHGRVVTTGMDKDIKSLIRPDLEAIDLKGRTVIPGLCDAHLHFS